MCWSAFEHYVGCHYVPTLCLLIASLLSPSSFSLAAESLPPMLKEIQGTNDPIRRIELLDEALKDSSIKGESLSTLGLRASPCI